MTDSGFDDLDELFGEEDLISLLDDVQEAQDKKTEQSLADSASGKDVNGDSADISGIARENAEAMASTSSSVYRELMDGLSEEEMELVGGTIVRNKSIEDYDVEIFSPPQLNQIRLGIDHGVDVSFYDSADMTFRQMREIRIGLEQKLDVSFYANKYYRDKQMREIRLGLMERLDVLAYARLVYSLTDMQNKRAEQFKEKYSKDPASLDFDLYDPEIGLQIRTEDGMMRAVIQLTKPLPEDFGETALRSLLNAYGISAGLCIDKLDLEHLETDTEYEVAVGTLPCDGVDGYYEYFTELMDEPPRIKEDGSIDYRAQREYVSAKPGNVVAVYHPAKFGENGMCISGIVIAGYSGKDLPALQVSGIHYDPEKKTYIADKEGFLIQSNDSLMIQELMEIRGDVAYGKGNIKFDGSVHITGSVMENAIVEVSGDITVDGFVEGAKLKAGRDITIRRGVNGNSKGVIEAGRNVVAAFFEHTTINAGENIEAGYIMDSRASCKGDVKVAGRKAVICGGKVKAGRTIQTMNVGNKSHVRTELELAAKEDYGEKMSELVRRKRRLEDEMEQIREAMKTVLQKVGALTGRTNSIYLKFEDVYEKQSEELTELNKEQEALHRELEGTKNMFILINGSVYDNTHIKVNGNSLIVDEEKKNVRFYSQGRQIITE